MNQHGCARGSQRPRVIMINSSRSKISKYLPSYITSS
jgi:hypothetical protein